ncbi:hypothetical protein FHS18_002394 [Paenibacillus phyllosphaerae]|uniref:Uncharacterized protein n=1 Tax=Paenibacillus phyllosphaerae TaxID=274593 RepID=A0A7W5AXC7_9BACL|nr:hypothetical protein [Paenibacillus phyllosphaerae]MBB3110327.1 hypothetical protein [Paenibacillus phyllosphaerae]
MQTDRAAILTPDDVRNIHSYVQRKYAGLPTERHSEIVTDAMQRIVLRQLPDFPEEIRLQLTDKLLSEVVIEQKRPVGAEHVFAASLTVDLTEPRLVESLHLWAEHRLQLIVEQESFIHLVTTAADKLHAGNGKQDLQQQVWQSFSNEAAQHASTVTQARKIAPIRAQTVVRLQPAEQITPFVRRRPVLYGVLCMLVALGMLWYGYKMIVPFLPIKPQAMHIPVEPVEVPAARLNELPADLRYTEIDRERLTAYLNKKNSLLAEPEYRDDIIKVAKEKDIHPLLLFAITGQEQAFVPRSHKLAELMVNNPFNVYHSYLEYNTTLEQAAAIAGNTINRLSKDRPANIDPIQWINRQYAEDKNWWKGVSSILKSMKRHMETSAE